MSTSPPALPDTQAALSDTQALDALTGPGLTLHIGPSIWQASVQPRAVARTLWPLYRPYAAWPSNAPDAPIADLGVDLRPASLLRRFIRPKVLTTSDMASPWTPMPMALAPVAFEMAVNWSIATSLDRFLILHAACVAREDQALIIPGASGSGKSTLSAALAYRAGWRLLSDEFALIDLHSGLVYPYPRPISLKNAALEVARTFAPLERFSPIYPGTLKGRIGYLMPPLDAIAAHTRPAKPVALLFPAFRSGQSVQRKTLDASEVFVRLIAGSANYDRCGAPAFAAMSRLAALPAHAIRYDSTDIGLTLAATSLEEAS